ncbi:MAG: replication factor C small subunit [Candidatus Thermoplasmatota archaeon]|nr:replication factor C small subunit [Candidatus Thermoplasmatota archaeon]
MNDLWIEKYRPSKLDEVVGQQGIVDSLKAYANSGGIPHLLFAGPAGTGKTTCAIALAREIFGEGWHDNFEELNASDERGIDIVRGKIKNFARTAPLGQAPFKIIFLDEADSLTPDAQAALRRTMERYARICRFILSCNYSSKIIDPIQSRCAVFRFSTIGEEDIKKYLEEIANIEGLKITEDGMKALLYVARGDLRKAINALQTSATLSKRIDAEIVYRTTATAKPEEAKKVMETALRGNFMAAREILDKMLIDYGLSGEDIIKGMYSALFDLPIPEKTKAVMVEKIGDAEFHIVEGSNERIQIEALLANMVVLGRK